MYLYSRFCEKKEKEKKEKNSVCSADSKVKRPREKDIQPSMICHLVTPQYTATLVTLSVLKSTRSSCARRTCWFQCKPNDLQNSCAESGVARGVRREGRGDAWPLAVGVWSSKGRELWVLHSITNVR
jgi:hypothetical protein